MGVVHRNFRPRLPWPKPALVVWETGPVNPEATRSQARDLTAAVEAFKLRAAEVSAEASMVAMLTDPEIRGLQIDRLAEAIIHARAQIDVIQRVAEHHTPTEAI